MPPPPPQSAGIPCGQCEYVNEPERVYCHNCGAKLDRSLLPKGEEKKKQDNPDQARKRIAKMTNPSSGWFWRETKTLFKVAFFSALLAVIWLLLQKPEGVPEPSKEPATRLISSDMMEALGSPTPVTVSFSEDDINRFLKQSVKTKDTMVPGVQVVHAYAQCLPGVLRITSEESAFGYPLFGQIDYKLEVKAGKFSPVIVGGGFGRIAVDPQLMQYCDYAFGTLWSELDREHKQMDKMQKITVRQGAIELMTKGASAPK